jgi:hypothetical protein
MPDFRASSLILIHISQCIGHASCRHTPLMQLQLKHHNSFGEDDEECG